MLIYWSEITPAFWLFGGTSVGSPSWAAMLALVNTAFGPQGNINNLVYFFGYPPFHDITVGNNSNGSITGYNAGPGWDPVTGIGTLDLGATFGLAGTNRAGKAPLWQHH